MLRLRAACAVAQRHVKDVTGYEQTGCTLSMFANRLSFFFDFKGPSKAVDTGARPRQLSRLIIHSIHSFVVR